MGANYKFMVTEKCKPIIVLPTVAVTRYFNEIKCSSRFKTYTFLKFDVIFKVLYFCVYNNIIFTGYL